MTKWMHPPSNEWRETRLARRSLHEEIVDTVRKMILDGDLAPGSHIPELRLCEHLGISRTPLREALKVLAAEGLVELRVNRGAIIAPVTIEEITHTFEVLESLEALAGRLVAERIDADELEAILYLHAEMARMVEGSNRMGYFRLNREFHERIYEATHNPVLVGTYGGLSVRIMRTRVLPNTSPERWRRSYAEHQQIVDALAARDGPQLAKALVEHMRNTRKNVLHQLKYLSRESACEEDE